MTDPAAPDLRAVFEQTYTAPASRVQEEVWRSVFGDEYPTGLDPYSYITRSELARFVRDLRVGPGERLVDLGCGRGGAGLWVAAETGASLVGIDIAEARSRRPGLVPRAMGMDADFRLGTFEATGLDDGSADAVMSVDALLFTPDKAAALVELHRVLRPGRAPRPDDLGLPHPAGRASAAGPGPPAAARRRRVPGARLRRHAGLGRDRDPPRRRAARPRRGRWRRRRASRSRTVRRSIEEMHATTACMTRRVFLVAEAA